MLWTRLFYFLSWDHKEIIPFELRPQDHGLDYSAFWVETQRDHGLECAAFWVETQGDHGHFQEDSQDIVFIDKNSAVFFLFASLFNQTVYL